MLNNYAYRAITYNLWRNFEMNTIWNFFEFDLIIWCDNTLASPIDKRQTSLLR
jgi:hypothetical protein